MSLRNLAQSIKREEVLLPLLRKHLMREKRMIRKKQMSSKEVVVADALLTIDTFKERMDHYNHGEPEGQFFHPSRLGSCLRELWYHEKKAPHDKMARDDDPMREHIVFEMGTYIHVMFQNLCDRAGFLTKREIPIMDAPRRILGHADGELLIQGELYLLEIKTINPRRFTELVSSPQISHRKQITAYMKALGLKKSIVIYINKDSAQCKEFVVDFDPEFYQKEVANRIDTHFRNGKSLTPPEREGIGPRTVPCLYCSFTRVCFDTFEAAKFEKALKKKGKA